MLPAEKIANDTTYINTILNHLGNKKKDSTKLNVSSGKETEFPFIPL